MYITKEKMTAVMPLPWQQLCRWSCFNCNLNSQISSYTRIIQYQQSNGDSYDNVGTMSVLRKTPCPTQKSCKRGYLVFHRKRLEPRVLPWQHHGVILFLLWCTFLFPGLKIIASIFLEIFLIQYFIVLVELFMTSSLPSFA